jgi:hypothetical protein
VVLAANTVRDTNRGREVLVKTTTGQHALEVGVE